MQIVADYEESFRCCWINYTKSFGIDCHPGWNYDSVVINNLTGDAGGTCELVSPGSGNNCRVTLRFDNHVYAPGARCEIKIKEKRVCDP